MFNTGARSVAWHYPSQKDCLNCHNTAGGSTLGPETVQMNRMVGGKNQIDTWADLFETAPAKPKRVTKKAAAAVETSKTSEAVATAVEPEASAEAAPASRPLRAPKASSKLTSPAALVSRHNSLPLTRENVPRE